MKDEKKKRAVNHALIAKAKNKRISKKQVLPNLGLSKKAVENLPVEGSPRTAPKSAVAKSPRLTEAILKHCQYRICRNKFEPKRVDQVFCGKACRASYFKIQYGLRELCPHFGILTLPEKKR